MGRPEMDNIITSFEGSPIFMVISWSLKMGYFSTTVEMTPRVVE